MGTERINRGDVALAIGATVKSKEAKSPEKVSSMTIFRRFKLWRKAPEAKPKNMVKEYFDNLKKKKRRLKFNEYNYFKSLFKWLLCRKDPEEQIARKAREQITKDLDIIKIIEKLKEIDKMKMLLLNRHQRELFNFIEKPVITLKSEAPVNREAASSRNNFERKFTESKSKEMSKDEYDFLEEYSKLYAAYRHINDDKESYGSRYNEKLLEMMGESLLDVFRKVDEEMIGEIDANKFEVTVKRLMDPSKKILKHMGTFG